MAKTTSTLNSQLGYHARPTPRRMKVNGKWFDIHAKLRRDARSAKLVWVFPKKVETAADGSLVMADWTDIAKMVKDAAQSIQEWTAVMHRADDLSRQLEESEKWLWEDRLPFGDVCLLSGCPGQGKSLIAIDAAARITSGRLWPDESPERSGNSEAGDVIVISTEDSNGATLARLEAAGADMARVYMVRELHALSDSNDTIPVNISHTDYLDKLIRELDNPRLLIIDALTDLLPAQFNPNSDSEVRQIMRPLRDLARRHGVCVLLIGHTGKSKKRAAHATLGSVAWSASVRHLLMTEEAQDKGSYLLCVAKSNLGATRSATRYEIETADNGAPLVSIDPLRKEVTADEALSERNSSQDGPFNPGTRGPEPKKLNDAGAWLLERLADGPVASVTVSREAEEQGIRPATLKNARKRLDIRSVRRDDGAFFMELPKSSDSETVDFSPAEVFGPETNEPEDEVALVGSNTFTSI